MAMNPEMKMKAMNMLADIQTDMNLKGRVTTDTISSLLAVLMLVIMEAPSEEALVDAMMELENAIKKGG